MDDDYYDPANEPIWTLAQAVAWLMWADMNLVADARHWGLGQLDAYDYEVAHRASLAEREPPPPERDEKTRSSLEFYLARLKQRKSSFREAWKEIKERARTGELGIRMIDQQATPPKSCVPTVEWEFMEFRVDAYADGKDSFWFFPPDSAKDTTPRFRKPTIDRKEVLRVFPSGYRTPGRDSNQHVTVYTTAEIQASLSSPLRNRKGQDKDRVNEAAFEGFPQPLAGDFTKERAIEFLEAWDSSYRKAEVDRPTHQQWLAFAKAKLNVANPTARDAWRDAKLGAGFRGSSGRPRKS